MAGWLLDVRAAARGLLKARAFSAAVILTLALGTGASTAMVTVLRATLLRPAPFPDSDRLVILSFAQAAGDRVRHGGLPNDAIAMLERDAVSYERVGAWTNPNFNVTGFDQAERMAGEVASAGYFPALGVAPASGRGFRPDEDTEGTPRAVVVLGHSLWQRRFGGDPAVVGRHIRLNRYPVEVIGIMPRGFRGLSGAAEIWIPRALAPVLAFPYRSYSVVARLRPGATVPQALAEFEALTAPFVARAASRISRRPTVTPLNEARVDGTTRRTMLILFGAVGFLLLIACANVANLFLVRAVGRVRELAVRKAVGAGGWGLARLVACECVLLAAVGGAAGLVLGIGALRVIEPLIPARAPGAAFLSVGEFAEPRFDFWVLAVSWLLLLASAAVFGLWPALRAARTRPADALRAGSAGRARRGVHAALVGVEVALAMVLLAGAGLLLRGLWRLESLPLGFETERVVAFQVQTPLQSGSPDEAPALVRRVVEAAASVPGVSAAAATYYGPFEPGARHGVRFAGETTPPGGPTRWAGRHYVTPGYFELLDIPLRRGRYLTMEDRRGGPLAVVVSERAAASLFPGQDPIGKRFFLGVSDNAPADSMVEVVGVVGDVRYRPGPFPAEPDVYTSYYQFVSNVWAMIVARSATAPERLIPQLRAAVAGVDPDVGISDAGPLEQRGGNQLARRRLNALLLGGFAALALGLAAVGVYGVIAHQTAQRTREFGIRMALGAQAGDVTRMVLGRAVLLVAAGLAAGLLGAAVLTRLLASELYELAPHDPATFAVTAALLAAAGFLAAYLPAKKAAKVEPGTVLRE